MSQFSGSLQQLGIALEEPIHRYNLGRLQVEFHCMVSKHKCVTPQNIYCRQSDDTFLQAIFLWICASDRKLTEQESNCEVNKNIKTNYFLSFPSPTPWILALLMSLAANSLHVILMNSRQNEGSVGKQIISLYTHP